MDNVKQFALNNKVVKWRIFSLPYQRLRNYYESYGFKYIDTIYREGKAKVYEMNYILKYGQLVNATPIENENITIKVNGVHIISSSNYNYMLGIITILKNELSYSDTIYFKYEDDYSESLFVENKLKVYSYVRENTQEQIEIDEILNDVNLDDYDYALQYISRDTLLYSYFLLNVSDISDVNDFIDGVLFITNMLNSSVELI